MSGTKKIVPGDMFVTWYKKNMKSRDLSSGTKNMKRRVLTKWSMSGTKLNRMGKRNGSKKEI